VVHISTVHQPFDNRIYNKECRSLAARGFDVRLVVPAAEDFVKDGVRIVALPKAASRLRRMLVTSVQAAKAAVRQNADIYHFHDPELIPVGVYLRILGNPVVYDIHEDYETSIKQKTYLPRFVAKVLSVFVASAERILASVFDQVIAEKYYERRFPAATQVLNYPRDLPDEAAVRQIIGKPLAEPMRLLYTGNVTADRGALLHARLVRDVPNAEVHFFGQCSPELVRAMRDEAGYAADRLVFPSIGSYLPFEEIRRAYLAGGWLCGLAVFPDTPHYREKELTKFFEYMAFGLPIICSDFRVWRDVVKGNEAGLCVQPEDRAAVAGAVCELAENSRLRRRCAENGFSASREKFVWASEEEKLVQLYRRILSS